MCAINSILDQCYRPIEIIVNDDCSEVPFRLNEMNNEIDIKIIRNTKNLGTGNSHVRGIRSSKGRFISFLESDDIWLLDKLSFQINYMLENSLCMTWTGYIFANEMLH